MSSTQIEILDIEHKKRLEGIERRFEDRFERLKTQKQMEVKSLERIYEHRRELLLKHYGEKQDQSS